MELIVHFVEEVEWGTKVRRLKMCKLKQKNPLLDLVTLSFMDNIDI